VVTSIIVALPREAWEVLLPVRLAVSNFVVACRPFAANLRRGWGLPGFEYKRTTKCFMLLLDDLDVGPAGSLAKDLNLQF
jgi:hypothetical protein